MAGIHGAFEEDEEQEETLVVQEQDEELVVPVADARSQPDAVVVSAQNAASTSSAVVGSRRLVALAGEAGSEVGFSDGTFLLVEVEDFAQLPRSSAAALQRYSLRRTPSPRLPPVAHTRRSQPCHEGIVDLSIALHQMLFGCAIHAVFSGHEFHGFLHDLHSPNASTKYEGTFPGSVPIILKAATATSTAATQTPPARRIFAAEISYCERGSYLEGVEQVEKELEEKGREGEEDNEERGIFSKGIFSL